MSEVDKITVNTLLTTIKELESKLRYEAESNSVLYANQFHMVDAIISISAERDRLRAERDKVTAERDDYRELLLSSFYNLQRMLVTMRKRTPDICTDKMDEAMREVADAINRIQGGK